MSANDQSKSELAAKDDSLETADGREDKDERREEEKKEEINEQGDQVHSFSDRTLPMAFSCFCVPSMTLCLCSFLEGV